MYSARHRFLFVHIPKTAGNSVQDALRHHADDQITALSPHQDGVERFEVRSAQFHTHKHSTLGDYRREYGPDRFADLYRFTCVRNPWERCMSHYFSPHRGAVAWDEDAFVAFVQTQVRPVVDWLRLDQIPQALAEAVKNVHRVMRFESLATDFCRVCEEAQLPPLALAHRNASRMRNHLALYTPAAVQCVATLLAEEIDYFGYRFKATP